MKNILLAFVFGCLAVIAIALPAQVLAANYGDCVYGVGTYGNGCLPSPVPSPSPSASPDPSPSPSASASPSPSPTSSSNSSSQGSSGGSSVVVTPECRDTPPGEKAPWLYSAASQDGDSILLYFASAGEPVDKYVLQYGLKPGEYQYGSVNIGGKETRTFLVQSLYPNTTYYFRVRAGNGCATGPWSNELSAKTKSLVSTKQLIVTSTTLEYDEGDNTTTQSSNIALQELDALGTLKVKVKDELNGPVSGVQVNLDEDVRQSFTARDGVVTFEDVPRGTHQITVEYDGYSGEQTVDLKGKDNLVTMTVQKEDALISTRALVIGIVFLIAIILLMFFIIAFYSRDRKEEEKTQVSAAPNLFLRKTVK